jgi:4-hydroxybutyryl-CoA dehydratase / vinylacetyl-CoA-Delta-isomerase
MNSTEYLSSLNDGRATYFEGKKVHNITEHEILGKAARFMSESFDEVEELTRREGASPFSRVPKSPEELEAFTEVQRKLGMIFNVTYTSVQTLMTAAGRIAALNPAYRQRIADYCKYVVDNDLRVTQCITDAKGDRSKSPKDQTDPDAYLRVVERRKDGVVIRGAKLHISLASYGHELLVIPTKAMKEGEEAYSIACAVPVNAPGVKIMNVSFSPRHSDDRSFPFSSKVHQYVEGFVTFEDVFVPNERVFLDGEYKYAGVFAHSLGLWERQGGLNWMADEAEELLGLAQLIAEANGIDRIEHVRLKISDLISYATMIRATVEAAIAKCERNEDGAVFPNELFINAGKFYAASNLHEMTRHLHDIGGGGILTAPTPADFESNEFGHLAEKYMATKPGISGVYRSRLFNAIRDLTADTQGGWRLVTHIQSGGGLFAQRIVMRKHYPMERAKKRALHSAGIEKPA